jgi:hypothetical protein
MPTGQDNRGKGDLRRIRPTEQETRKDFFHRGVFLLISGLADVVLLPGDILSVMIAFRLFQSAFPDVNSSQNGNRQNPG